jgi:hypothetical protein
MTEIICSWNKAWNGILGQNSSSVFPSKNTPKRPPYLALQWHWEDECVDFKYPNTCNTEFEVWWMILLYTTHILITASSHHVALLGLDYIWENTNCSNCLTVYKVNFLLENSSNARNSLSELQEIQKFLGGMLPDPSRSSHLGWSIRFSQNPSYVLICCPMTYAGHIYAGWLQWYRLDDWNFSRSPAKYVLSSYTSLKEALNFNCTIWIAVAIDTPGGNLSLK